MRTIVVRLDPTTFDPVASASAPGETDSAALKLTWNAWNSKARALLEQDSRIENLYWRRWHMEQRQGTVLHSPALQSGHSDMYGLQSSVEAHERRKATEDLEAFLRTTLQQAQPSDRVPPQPPTFGGHVNGGGRPGPGSRKGSSFSARPPSVGSGSRTPIPQTPVIHAPQPRVPFQASPDWSYTNLPPVSTTSHHTGIVSTPSWTAVIPANAVGNNNSSANVTSAMQASGLPSPAQMPPPPTTSGVHSNSSYSYQHLQPSPSQGFALPPTNGADTSLASAAASFPFASTSNAAMPSPSLPPNATIFSDLPSALSSAPPIGAPPAFFSSYGMYQPVIAPYPRFLTPSPEPSVLGDLELELGPSAGEFMPNGDGLDDVWKDLEERDGLNGPDGLVPIKKDPFEGMTLAQMRSRANSLEAVDRAAARYNPFASDAMVTSAAEEVKNAAQSMSMSVSPPSDDLGGTATATTGPGKKGKRKANGANGGTAGLSKKNRAVGSANASLAPSPETENDHPDGSRPALAGGGRKNRNPHSTQLPGPRRIGKIDPAEEGHEGPICSHCGSVTTPLWRRGPDDELLCNACGLYLKLHGKSRPKTFGKSGTPRRTSAGAAAQAASSGVPPSCNNCGATSTPMWRKDAEGNLCCNACSLYYKLHKVNRPASLAQKRAAAAAAKAHALASGSATSSTAPSPQGGGGSYMPLPTASTSETPAGSSTGPSPTNAQLPTPTASTEVTPASAQGTPAAAATQTPATPALALPPVSGPPPSGPPSHAAPPAHPPHPMHHHPGFYPPPPHMLDPSAAQHMHFHPQQPMWPPHPFAPAAYPPPFPPPPQHGGPQPEQNKYSLPPPVPPSHPISPHALPATPFAQTAWGQLAYGIVAAAAEEAHAPGQPYDGHVQQQSAQATPGPPSNTQQSSSGVT